MVNQKNLESWTTETLAWLDANERSQAWLAKHAKVTVFYLNRCLLGHRQPSKELLLRLETVMELPAGLLVSRRNGEQPAAAEGSGA